MRRIIKFLKWLLIVGVIAAVAGICYLTYLGLFSELKVYEKETGPYVMVYERYVGPYKDTGKVYEKVVKMLEADGVKTYRGIGIYYDDPAVTPAEKLRSDNGCLIEDNNLSRLKELKKKFNVKMIDREWCLVTEFPIKGPISFMLGPVKGYPALMEYAKTNGIKWAKDAMPVELYDLPAGKIYYMMGIVKGSK